MDDGVVLVGAAHGADHVVLRVLVVLHAALPEAGRLKQDLDAVLEHEVVVAAHRPVLADGVGDVRDDVDGIVGADAHLRLLESVGAGLPGVHRAVEPEFLRVLLRDRQRLVAVGEHAPRGVGVREREERELEDLVVPEDGAFVHLAAEAARAEAEARVMARRGLHELEEVVAQGALVLVASLDADVGGLPLLGPLRLVAREEGVVVVGGGHRVGEQLRAVAAVARSEEGDDLRHRHGRAGGQRDLELRAETLRGAVCTYFLRVAADRAEGQYLALVDRHAVGTGEDLGREGVVADGENLELRAARLDRERQRRDHVVLRHAAVDAGDKGEAGIAAEILDGDALARVVDVRDAHEALEGDAHLLPLVPLPDEGTRKDAAPHVEGAGELAHALRALKELLAVDRHGRPEEVRRVDQFTVHALPGLEVALAEDAGHVDAAERLDRALLLLVEEAAAAEVAVAEGEDRVAPEAPSEVADRFVKYPGVHG